MPFFDDQVGAMVSAREEGLIRVIGLSNVSLSHLRRTLELTEVVCVQKLLPSERPQVSAGS